MNIKSFIARGINILFWGLILVFIFGVLVGLSKSNWVFDSLKNTYDRSLWQFMCELGFILGLISMGIAGISFFLRQMMSGRRFSEIPAMYGKEYNRVERRLANIGIITSITSLIGIAITHH